MTTQHVAGLQPVEEAGEAAALRSGNVPGHRFGDHAAGLDLEARCRDFLTLVVRRLAGGGDAAVAKVRGMGTFRSKRMVKLNPCPKPFLAISEQAAKD